MSKFNCFLCHQDMNGDPITKEEIDYIKEKIKSLETKLKEMTYNYQGAMSDCDHYEDVIKELETKLALSEKKLDRAIFGIKDHQFISMTRGQYQGRLVLYEALKEIEEMK